MKTIQTITAALSLLLATGTGKIHNNEVSPGTPKPVVTVSHETLPMKSSRIISMHFVQRRQGQVLLQDHQLRACICQPPIL